MPENIIPTDNSFITNLENIFYICFPFVTLAIDYVNNEYL